MQTKELGLLEINSRGSCNLFLTSSLESFLADNFDMGENYKNAINLTIEELVFRHLQQKSKISENLLEAISHCDPDYDSENKKFNQLKQGLLVQSYSFAPIQNAIDRAKKFLLNPSNSSTTAKILLKVKASNSVNSRKAYCIAVSLGELTDQPFDQSVWNVDKGFRDSLFGAEDLAYRLTGKARPSKKYRKIIPLEPTEALSSITGKSASAAFLFAHLSNIKFGLLSSPNSTFSCEIDFQSLEPSFKSVNHIAEKVVAASEAGLKRVFVHADNRSEADKSKTTHNLDIEIVTVSGRVKDSWEKLLNLYLDGVEGKNSELEYRLKNKGKLPWKSYEAQIYEISQVLPLQVRKMQKDWHSEYGVKKVDSLIVSVSNVNTVIMSYWVFRPQKLFLLSNSDLEDYDKTINLIKSNILENPLDSSNTRLRSENFKVISLEKPEDATAIYNTLLSETSLKISLKKRECIFADITGGLKPMSSVLSQFAWQYGIQTVYVASEFQGKNRILGSERLKKIANPKEILKKEEFEKALELFREGRYHAAAKRFYELKEITDLNTSMLNFLIKLANYYANRMLLNFDEVIRQAGEIRELGLLDRVTISPDKVLDNIKHQLRFASEKKTDLFRICEFYTVASRKHELNDFNTAFIIYYRFLEAVIAYKLAEHGIENTGKPVYSSILKNMSEEDLLLKLNKELNTIELWKEKLDELPSRLGLFMGIAVLTVIDSFVAEINSSIKIVKKMYRIAEIRNNSVLSHGYASIGEDECDEFKKTANFVLKKFLENNDIEYDNFVAHIGFQEIHSIDRIG